MLFVLLFLLVFETVAIAGGVSIAIAVCTDVAFEIVAVDGGACVATIVCSGCCSLLLA